MSQTGDFAPLDPIEKLKTVIDNLGIPLPELNGSVAADLLKQIKDNASWPSMDEKVHAEGPTTTVNGIRLFSPQTSRLEDALKAYLNTQA